MKLNTASFFGSGDIEKIERTIRDVEKKTSGEIVVVVTPQSSRYLDIAVIGGMLPALLAGYACGHFINLSLFKLPSFFGVSELFLLMFVVTFFAGYFLLLFFPSLMRLFMSDRRKEFEIRKKALRSFYDYELYNTKDSTGVLFLISLLERRIYILADRGILAKVGTAELEKYAKSIGSGIRTKESAEAICSVIQSLGEVLSREFPASKDNPNELPDRVILE